MIMVYIVRFPLQENKAVTASFLFMVKMKRKVADEYLIGVPAFAINSPKKRKACS